MILDPCPAVAAATAGRGGEGKYGWDLVPERDLVESAATDSPVASPARGPQLQYLGRDACSTLTPCQECVGDCDSDDDCSIGLSCFERERGDVLQVPGCGTGGPGDIPGADYCYVPLSDDDDDDGGTTSVTPSPSAPPSLRWLGSEGCTPTRPCGACSGDCDEDDDCLDGHACFKRLVGDFSPVPGCGVGGPGDIPGGDYCYDSRATAEATPTMTEISPTPSITSGGAGVSDEPAGSARPTPPPPPLPSLPPSTMTGSQTPAGWFWPVPTESTNGGPSTIAASSRNSDTATAETGSKTSKETAAPSLELYHHTVSGGVSSAVAERTRQHSSTRHEREHHKHKNDE